MLLCVFSRNLSGFVCNFNYKKLESRLQAVTSMVLMPVTIIGRVQPGTSGVKKTKGSSKEHSLIF